jgi:phosphatidylethanolamine/phosphatidyl-N-methylethanolamine N-methyltransferase
MARLAKLNAAALFLKEAVRRPGQIGAIAPSSPQLTRAMSEWLPQDPDALVLELGPGSGAVTDALIRRGLPQHRLVAVEMSPDLATMLRKKYPQAHIITGNALDIDTILQPYLPGTTGVGAVISSLPLLNFPPELSRQLSAKIHQVLRPQGRLVQFSYHVTRKQIPVLSNFRHIGGKVVWLNLPPARVGVYER